MSAAPGNQTPTLPAGPPLGGRRRALFAAALVAGLAVMAGGTWALARGGTQGQGTAIGQAVPDPTGSPEADPATSDGTGPASTGTPVSAATTEPPATSAPPSAAAAPIDPALLASVLIDQQDLGGIALPLDDSTFASGQDADHPLTDYAYCNRSLDRSRAGGAAKRVLTTNPLSPEGIVASTATVFASAADASAVIDAMVANARACTSYTISGTLPATVTIESAERTTAGARIVEQVDTAGASAEIRVMVNQVGDLVVTLEVTPVTADPVGLERLLTTRAGELPR